MTNREHLRADSACRESWTDVAVKQWLTSPSNYRFRAVGGFQEKLEISEPRTESPLESARARLQLLVPDVSELDFHRRTGVQLQAQQPFKRAARFVIIDHRTHDASVDYLSDRVPTRDDVQ